MFEHPLPWLIGVLVGYLTALAAAIATRVRLLPEVIDFSIVPTAAGVGGLLAAGCGAALRLEPDRLARVTLFGNLFGAAVAAIGLSLALLIDVLS